MYINYLKVLACYHIKAYFGKLSQENIFSFCSCDFFGGESGGQASLAFVKLFEALENIQMLKFCTVSKHSYDMFKRMLRC